MHEDESQGWASFFGVLAGSLGLVAVVLAIGVGILLGYYVIGDGGSSPHETAASNTTAGPAGASGGSSEAAATLPAALVSAGEGLKAPAGVTAKLWTSGLPDVSDLAYDSEGRLWATAAHDPLSKGPIPAPGDGVYLLEKGRAPLKVIGTVDKPIGLAWFHNRLFVANYGHIDLYSGFNGHSFAYHRILFNHIGAGIDGWSDNPAVGPEGRIYEENASACDSACPKHGYLEAETISFNPDGSGLKVFARGIRGNSYSEFMPGTHDLFQVMDQQNGLVPAPDDQLGIVREGENWGFPTCYGQGGSVCQGIATAIAYLPQHYGSAGLALVNGQLGPAYGTSAFVTSVSSGVVDRVPLAASGAAYRASGPPEEFLTGLKAGDPILLTPKGSLLVGDYAAGRIYELTVDQSVNPGASATIAVKVPATTTGKAPATPSTEKTAAGTPSSTKATAPTSSSATVEASPNGELKYVQSSISLKSGASTVDFVNKSMTGHDVVVEQNGKTYGETPVITGSTTALKLNLKPGTYKFFCSVPGHRMAGMEGTLTVK